MDYTIADLLAGLFGIGVLILCVTQWRHVDKWAERFRLLQAPMYGQRFSDLVYTPTNLRVGLIAIAIVGLIMIGMGVTGRLA